MAEDRTEEFIEALDEIEESGDNMIGVRDDTVAALLAVIGDDDELRGRLKAKLDKSLDREVAELDERAIMRLLLRVGLSTADPDLWENLRDAVGERARRRA